MFIYSFIFFKTHCSNVVKVNSKPDDPAKRTYLIADEKIRIVYQLGPNRIISSYKEFKKPGQEQKGFSVEMTGDFEVRLSSNVIHQTTLVLNLF